MAQYPAVAVEILDERQVFTLRQVCEVCGLHAERVLDMVAEGIVEPQGGAVHEWRFTGMDVVRIHVVLRLERDLRVNLPGAALALDLLEEVRTMRELLRALQGG